MYTNKTHTSPGQVMITMLYVMIIGILITTGAAYALIANTQATTRYELGSLAYSAAENGIENALLRLIRDPAYAGETLVFDTNRSAVVTVSSNSGVIVTSTGTFRDMVRRIEAHFHYNGGVLIIDSWKEI